jgi:hypothetical protein
MKIKFAFITTLLQASLVVLHGGTLIKGIICLQIHAGKLSEAGYRNITIEKLL